MKAKENQLSPSGEQVLSQEKAAINFNQAYLQSGDELLPLSPAYVSSNPPVERNFRSQKELEELVYRNSKTLFGQHTILVSLPKESNSLFGKEFLPNGFLLDASDLARPRFYVLDIMLAKQNFYGSVFPRFTKFFFLLKNSEIIERLCDIISKDKAVRKELQAKMKAEDIPYFLRVAITQRPFILLVMESEMKELPEVMQTYAETWQQVKPLVIRKFTCNSHAVCTMHPSFSELHPAERKSRVRSESVIENKEIINYTEEFHLQKSSENMREVYNAIKADLQKTDNSFQFNPQRYYISLKNGGNIAFFHFSRKKISLVVKHPEKDTRKLIKHHEVKTLTAKVQKFWNGPSCTIVIENEKYLNEVTALLKKLIGK